MRDLKRLANVCDPANYRTISNLNIVSKILERLVLVRTPDLHASTPTSYGPVGVYETPFDQDNIAKKTDYIFAGFDDHQSTILVALTSRSY